MDSKDLQTTLPIMPNLPVKTQANLRQEDDEEEEGELNGSKSCQMKTGVTFGSRNEENQSQEVSSDFLWSARLEQGAA